MKNRMVLIALTFSLVSCTTTNSEWASLIVDDYGKFSKGHICFQDHPGKVSFRSIFIRELD